MVSPRARSAWWECLVIDIRLSGTVEVYADGVRLDLPGPRVRALFVLLALSAGRAVSVDTLAHGIWDDAPPENVRGSLQTYVGRLRRVLGTDVVTTGAIGYALRVPRDAVDLLRFQDLVAEAGGQQDPAAERDALETALQLWVGVPFGGAPSEWIERQLVPQWTERHLQATERRVDLDLQHGEHAPCIPLLQDLIERHPLRETLWVRLLTAMDLGGRTAEALQQYEVLRNRLAGELGVDPAPEVQHVFHALLAKETPPTTGAAATTAPAERQRTVPRQLPPPVGGFTGRAAEMAALEGLLGAADGPPLVALHGPGGTGKTTLACQWAHRHADTFPDGQLFVDLRGYGPGEPREPLDALDSLLRALGVHGTRIPADPDERSALLREALAGKRALLVLDNARDAAQVRPLLAGDATTTIVTSRSQLRGLVSREGARRISLAPMTAGDATALLGARLGIGVGDEEASALDELAELCGRLPVALAVAAERAGRDGRVRLDEVNERLRDARTRLEELTTWEDDPLTDVRAVFSWSYEALDPDSARMFRLLAVHPDNVTSVDMAAALAGAEVRAAERLLDRLTERHLLTEAGNGWYRMHDLTRTYADSLAATDGEAEHAVRRLRSWYIHSIRNARYSLERVRLEYPIAEPVADVTPTGFGSSDQSFRWLVTHYDSIQAVLWEAESDGDDEFVSKTAPYLYSFLRRTGAAGDSVDLYAHAIRAARARRDPLVEAVCTTHLGSCFDHLGDSETAIDYHRRALEIFTELDHAYGRVDVQSRISHPLYRLGRFEEVVAVCDSALDIAQWLPTTDETVSALNDKATGYLALGASEQARTTIEQALAIERATNDSDVDETTLGTMLITLGEVHSADGRWTEAVSSLNEAVRLFETVSYISNVVAARRLRGVAHRELGHLDAARTDWQQALAALDEIGADHVLDASRDDIAALLAKLPAAHQ